MVANQGMLKWFLVLDCNRMKVQFFFFISSKFQIICMYKEKLRIQINFKKKGDFQGKRDKMLNHVSEA